MTTHDPQTSSTSPAASTLGNRMLAQVMSRYNQDMQPIQKNVLARSLADIVLGDPAASQQLTLGELAALTRDPNHGERLSNIVFYDLVLAIIDEIKAKAEATTTPASEPEAPKTGKGKSTKAAAAPAKKEKATPAKGKEKAAAPAAPAAPRKNSGQKPAEFDAAANKIIAAVKKSNGEGLKIAGLVDASGHDKNDATKIVAKLLEEKKLEKKAGTAGPGTRYVLPGTGSAA